MTALHEKSLAELKKMSANLRERIKRDPQHSVMERIQLDDVEWEVEKRSWRKKYF
jgi:hypothetical protein